MRFYEFNYVLQDVDKVTQEKTQTRKREWFGSERDAVVQRLELFKAGRLAGKKKDNPIWAVDIPTSKQGLLRWLQAECVQPLI